MKPPSILITSVGTLVGKVILDSLEGRRAGLRVVGCDAASEAISLPRCDQGEVVPLTDAPGWDDAILALIQRESPFAVIPGRDGDVERLATLAERHPTLAAIFIGGSRAMAEVIGDKVRTAEFSFARGLPFAATVSSDHPEAARLARELVLRHGFPLIAKPRDGSGSLGVRILTEARHLDGALRRPGMAIQPYLDPSGPIELPTDAGLPLFWEVTEDRLHGVHFILGRDGKVLGRCGFRSRMVRGRCEELWACDDAVLLAVGDAFATAAAEAGWRGPLNIQAKRDAEGRWQVIELNGRFSGGTSSRRYFGFDEVRLVLNEWFGHPIIPTAHLTPVRRVVRQLADYPATNHPLPA